MAEYIEREDAIKMVVESAVEIFDYHTTVALSLLKVANKIRRIPTADVAEVKHGEWISLGLDDNDMEMVKCSECNIKRFGRSLYCSHCGAKMDLKEGAKE